MDKQNFSDLFIRTQLLNSTKPMQDKNARLFYWNCISATGYSDPGICQEYQSESFHNMLIRIIQQQKEKELAD